MCFWIQDIRYDKYYWNQCSHDTEGPRGPAEAAKQIFWRCTGHDPVKIKSKSNYLFQLGT